MYTREYLLVRWCIISLLILSLYPHISDTYSKTGDAFGSNNSVNDLKPMFSKCLNIVKTAPNALSAAPANTFALTLNHDIHAEILLTIHTALLSPVLIDQTWILCYPFLCITFVLSLFTHTLHLFHHG